MNILAGTLFVLLRFMGNVRTCSFNASFLLESIVEETKGMETEHGVSSSFPSTIRGPNQYDKSTLKSAVMTCSNQQAERVKRYHTR